MRGYLLRVVTRSKNNAMRKGTLPRHTQEAAAGRLQASKDTHTNSAVVWSSWSWAVSILTNQSTSHLWAKGVRGARAPPVGGAFGRARGIGHGPHPPRLTPTDGAMAAAAVVARRRRRSRTAAAAGSVLAVAVAVALVGLCSAFHLAPVPTHGGGRWGEGQRQRQRYHTAAGGMRVFAEPPRGDGGGGGQQSSSSSFLSNLFGGKKQPPPKQQQQQQQKRPQSRGGPPLTPQKPASPRPPSFVWPPAAAGRKEAPAAAAAASKPSAAAKKKPPLAPSAMAAANKAKAGGRQSPLLREKEGAEEEDDDSPLGRVRGLVAGATRRLQTPVEIGPILSAWPWCDMFLCGGERRRGKGDWE